MLESFSTKNQTINKIYQFDNENKKKTNSHILIKRLFNKKLEENLEWTNPSQINDQNKLKNI